MKKTIILLLLLLVLAGGIGYVSTFHLDSMEVTGNEMVTEKEVENSILKHLPWKNTLVLYLQNKINPPDDIPFVAKYDIDYEGKHKVIVTVYEKSVAGCVEYMENYLYFDKDGTVLETLKEKKDQIPCIRGLEVSEWEVGKKLPVLDQKKFQTILSLTQLIDKYKLDVDGITFTGTGEVELHCGDILVQLGDGSNLQLQMMNLGNILAGIKGKSGVLYMKDFSEENQTASFKPQ